MNKRLFQKNCLLRMRDCPKELYTGTPNSDIRILCTVHSGRNLNKPSAPIAVERKGFNSNKQSGFTVQQNRLIDIPG